MKNYHMFCRQCQETAGCSGCTVSGVCGKKPETAALQDGLIYSVAGLAELLTVMRERKLPVEEKLNDLVAEDLFVTITNANFDDDRIRQQILETQRTKAEIFASFPELAHGAQAETLSPAAWWTAEEASHPAMGLLTEENEDAASLRELILYGLKGMAAYRKHAKTLGYREESLDAFLQKALAAAAGSQDTEELTALALETGKYGVEAMALLDRANTETYGNPEVTKVDIGVRNRPGILISGHDLRDLEQLLEQTEGTGVDVYTHSEMLPAHYYPAFKKYSHFAGNYGNAWWKQREEFEAFHGPVLLTTNCLVPPLESYKDRVYTTGAVGFPGCRHIPEGPDGRKDFSELIRQAKESAPPKELERGTITGGFAHGQVFALADQVVAAVKSGAIRKFVVMAGCDGRSRSREYYTEFAKALPADTVILTAGCAKYRYNKLDLGEIGGIPRVLDAGQCNDSYSLVLIALKLKEALGLEDVNDLPIVYNIAWYEQKAVIVLLALLSLGIKNIHLGPTLPAFLSPNVAKLLTEQFGIAGITTVDGDLKEFFG